MQVHEMRLKREWEQYYKTGEWRLFQREPEMVKYKDFSKSWEHYYKTGEWKCVSSK